MEYFELTAEDINYLKNKYPYLIYDKDAHLLNGIIHFDLTYPSNDGIRIKGRFNIEILLVKKEGTILPIVKETRGKIAKIVRRKNLENADLHLNSDNGGMCIIIPPKEKERYPNGFDLKEYLNHIEEHLYWISYFDRYEKPPWKGQAHGEFGYVQLFKEDNKRYKKDVKEFFEKKYKKYMNRQQFNKTMRDLIKKYKL